MHHILIAGVSGRCLEGGIRTSAHVRYMSILRQHVSVTNTYAAMLTEMKYHTYSNRGRPACAASFASLEGHSAEKFQGTAEMISAMHQFLL